MTLKQGTERRHRHKGKDRFPDFPSNLVPNETVYRTAVEWEDL